MDRKKKLTAEEKAIFAEAMRNLDPGSKKNFPPQRLIEIQSEFSLVDLQDLSEDAWVSSEDRLSFSRPGLQNNLLKKISQGKITIERQLDLHGMRVNHALAYTQNFLEQCQQQGIRFALIIHGKSHLHKKPILKNALNIWLRTQSAILAFQTAIPRHGGAGALYILIKKVCA